MVNKDEAIELILSDKKNKTSDKDLNDFNFLLQKIKSYGPELVLITDGKNGAHAYNGQEVIYQEALSGQRDVDMTGVGDAYNSTFAAAVLIYNGDIKKSLLAAAKNAASKISFLGAQNGLLTKKELIK